MIRIKKGLDLPLAGAPKQEIGDSRTPRSVAVLGRDYVGMKPTMAVQAGEKVKLGQALFTDKKNPAVRYTAPGAGTVSAINRGYQRRLLSVVIELEGEESESFASFDSPALANLSAEVVVEQLVKSGLWTALRTRPFSKVPDPQRRPLSLFITAVDSNPHAPDPDVVLADSVEDFVSGVQILDRLAENRTHLCLGHQDKLRLAEQAYGGRVEVSQFIGPHPSGLVGTHMHLLEPAGAKRQCWHIGYQDVVAVGRLFRRGMLDTSRVVSLSGPQVLEPRLLRSRIGASLDEMVAGELQHHESRVVSGSVLGGFKASGDEAYLGRYHNQVSILREGRERPLLGYLSPGSNRHSIMGIYLSQFDKARRFAMSTSTMGSERAMVPIGAYEKVMPLDILPTQLLRSLIVGDIEMAMNLGALELDEEDLALCTYVCPGKYEYGPILRENLTRIEKEG